MNEPETVDAKIRIVFLIRSLYFGGAERQLLTLVRGIDREQFEPFILSFYKGGELEAEFVKAGIPVIALEKTGRWDVFSFFARLIAQVRALRPDLLHGYLTMSDILAVPVKLIIGKVKIIFGVRYAYMDLSKYDWLTRLVYRLEIWLSPLADLIIVNSNTGRRNHIRNGFAGKRMVVIPNGIDTEQFRPSPAERAELRARLGVDDQTHLVGLVGRLDPVKDHSTFLRAAARVAAEDDRVKFICVGDGEAAYAAELRALAGTLKITHKLLWLEGQKNVRAVYNALDLCCSASIGESFSNVIAEAMACGLPCVVTDVGDSALIVDQYGVVAPVGDPEALAIGLLKMLRLPDDERRQLGLQGRQRILDNFSVERMIRKTEMALINLRKGIVSE